VAQEWLDAATLTRRLETDGPLPPNTAARLVDSCSEAWGQGFAAPVFSEEVVVLSQRLVGEKHLALKLRHQGQPIDAIWFGHAEPLPARAPGLPAGPTSGRACGAATAGGGAGNGLSIDQEPDAEGAKDSQKTQKNAHSRLLN
jgi:hypothetical protein